MRSIEEIDDIIEIIREKLIYANRLGDLDSLLEKWGICDNDSICVPERYRQGKIVVIGETKVSIKDLLFVAKSCGLDEKRFEFYNYNAAKNFNYKKMIHSSEYSAVLFGPIPHSVKGKGDSSSIIVEIENNNAYPPVKRLTSGGELKITKHNFEKALTDLLNKDIIRADYSC